MIKLCDKKLSLKVKKYLNNQFLKKYLKLKKVIY